MKNGKQVFCLTQASGNCTMLGKVLDSVAAPHAKNVLFTDASGAADSTFLGVAILVCGSKMST